MNHQLRTLWQNNKSFLLFIFLLFAFRSAVADWNDVPTGSMKPTIEVGDRVHIDKLAYDVQIPFAQVSVKQLADPQRGDVIVFESEVSDKRLIKRVIGIPGDVVAMYDNKLVINGKPLEYKVIQKDGENSNYQIWEENLNGIKHKVQVLKSGSRFDNFAPVEVPEGHYLALGDNRDHSADSRVIGFVPRAEIIGRSNTVVMSLDYDNYFLPRGERFLKPMDS